MSYAVACGYALRSGAGAGSVGGMNPPRASDEDYIQFPIATPSACSAVEAARCQPRSTEAPAHDAFSRLLTRLEPDPAALWAEVAPLLPGDGVLVVDDATLDKPYARRMDLVTPHWSGKHKAVVRGINLITAVWYKGRRLLPVDYRVYRPAADAKTKNDHFRDMLGAAHARGLRLRCVLFDGWYASLDNLKRVRDRGWVFLTRLKGNRLVRVDRGDPRAVADQPVAAGGTTVWLPGYGELRVFRVTAPDGRAEHWATGDLGMTDLTRHGLARESWAVETYHRGLKQHTEVEGCQARLARSQLNHIGLAVRAFVRLEWHRWVTGATWFEAKHEIIRAAVRRYLKDPRIVLPQPATA